ncbi:MAG: sel1 repeat family protein [Magnetococcales bacterium]|nr:sel1 repeat family protein [Magnetococcales bacterium]
MKTTSIIDLFLDQQDEAFTLAVHAHQNRDYTQAFTAFERLAQHNDPQAQINLACMLRDGQGVATDLVAAHMWLELASREGDVIATREQEQLRPRLSPEQLTQSRQMAASWALRAEIQH